MNRERGGRVGDREGGCEGQCNEWVTLSGVHAISVSTQPEITVSPTLQLVTAYDRLMCVARAALTIATVNAD